MMVFEASRSSSIESDFRPTAYLIEHQAMPLSSLALYRLVRDGFALAKVRAMVASSPLYSATSALDRILGYSGRRGQRQEKQGHRVLLNARQSATAYQYAQALERAIVVFGNQLLAEHWLGRPCKFLAGNVPLDIIENWWGFQSVEDYLQKIELGIYH